jgi:hypothetical protein
MYNILLCFFCFVQLEILTGCAPVQGLNQGAATAEKMEQWELAAVAQAAWEPTARGWQRRGRRSAGSLAGGCGAVGGSEKQPSSCGIRFKFANGW